MVLWFVNSQPPTAIKKICLKTCKPPKHFIGAKSNPFDIRLLRMDYTALIILISLGLLFVMVRTFYDSGKKALGIFPDIRTVNIKYRDKTATGYSTQSWKTKAGGASRVIDIVVTDHELWLRSFLLFAGITKQHDLLHKIQLTKITRTQRNRDEITVDFKNEKGEKKQVVLRTRNGDEFLKSIGRAS
jgi:hypothetical protein